MRGLMTLVVASVLGAGAFGVFKGMQVKEQILDERRQAREDSIAAVALAISQAALADSSSSSESSLTGEQPDMPDSTAVEAVDRPDGDTPVAAGGGGGVQTPPGPEASGGESEVPEDPGPSREELAAAARQAAEARALALQTMDRLSKIFSEMKPGEAAEVLSFLSDEEIERVLLGIRERDAAAILAQLDPERAAAVSRRVLRKGGTGP